MNIKNKVHFYHQFLITYRKQFARHFSIMMNPLVAVCQMTSTNDKEKNLQTIRELVEKAKSKTACVSTYI